MEGGKSVKSGKSGKSGKSVKSRKSGRSKELAQPSGTAQATAFHRRPTDTGDRPTQATDRHRRPTDTGDRPTQGKSGGVRSWRSQAEPPRRPTTHNTKH